MRKIVFIVTSYWAWGELRIAIRFAQSLHSTQCIFILPPTHECRIKEENFHYRILIPKARRFNQLLLLEVQNTYKPDLVILSDLLNFAFCEKHYGLNVNDLSCFKCRLGGFDLYNIRDNVGKTDTYGFIDKKMKQLDTSSLSLFLQPCPILSPIQKINEDVIRYSLFDSKSTITEEDRYQSRKELGIRDDDRVILITNASWQQNHKLYPETQKFVKSCHDATYAILNDLPENYVVICLGPLRVLPENCGARFRYLNQMSKGFRNLIAAIDLYLCNNFISTSMIEIALSGVPVLLLQNSYFKFNGKQGYVGGKKYETPELVANIEKVYPFRMFPVGWYLFLDPIIQENPFFDIIPKQEIYNTSEATGKVVSMLTNDYREYFYQKISALRNILDTLPKPAVLFEAI
jgi:hypothetical protein